MKLSVVRSSDTTESLYILSWNYLATEIKNKNTPLKPSSVSQISNCQKIQKASKQGEKLLIAITHQKMYPKHATREIEVAQKGLGQLQNILFRVTYNISCHKLLTKIEEN